MPYSFQRVSQSLRADHAIRSNIAILTALVLLCVWIVWALRATLPIYRVSDSAQIIALAGNSARVLAQFPNSAVSAFHPGQTALFRTTQPGSLPSATMNAYVTRAGSLPREGKVQVELSVDVPTQRQVSLGPGSVEVEVERVTPATLLIRSAGALVGGH